MDITQHQILEVNKSDIVYVDVILPLAIANMYTYSVPSELRSEISIGKRVEVPLRRKFYSGIISHIYSGGVLENVKHIASIIDDVPIVTELQIQFWNWISDYYCCTLGEVMNVALPTGLKLFSETKIALNPYMEIPTYHQLNAKEYLIIEALKNRDEITIDEIRSLLNQKTVYPIIKKLLKERYVFLKEEMKEKYKPKLVDYIRLTALYKENEEKLNEAFEIITRSKKQTEALLAFVQLQERSKEVSKKAVYEMANVNSQVINALVKKEIIEVYSKQVSRLELAEDVDVSLTELTKPQSIALQQINNYLSEKSATLLHGITGSGKTRVYIEKINEVVEQGGQVLYLLPEIGLTTQMLSRIQGVFGSKVGFYHSKMNIHERVELWENIMMGLPIVLAARSGLLLPFQNLELIIVDEEHDPSYKQQDPNPRYNARDASLILAQLSKAKVILGTATPSLETLLNTSNGKYGYVHLNQRYGKAQLPEIKVVNLLRENKEGGLTENFSRMLLTSIQDRLSKQEQVILFQNRRGYAPILKCYHCGWHSQCSNCDVSLTVHQYYNELKCHYCGFRASLYNNCPSCGSIDLKMMGFGTEKIAETISRIFPEARVARMDHDTVRTKNSHESILQKLEKSEVDILIGTQMVTKGLDFDKLTLVGILNADSLLNFPDFRAAERAFHLLTQVSGRAGRREIPGKVIIQTSNPKHLVIRDVIKGDYTTFAHRELKERKEFKYAPYYKLISILLKHKIRSSLSKLLICMRILYAMLWAIDYWDQ